MHLFRHFQGRIFQPRWFVLAALAVAAGCGGGGGGGGNSGGGAGIPATTSLSISKSAGLGSLFVTLSQSRAALAVGGTNLYTLSIINPTNASGPIAVVARSVSNGTDEPQVTLQVLDPSGNPTFPVVTPQASPPPPPGVRIVTLQPGQSLSSTQTQKVFNVRGQYRATATFRLSSSLSVAPKTVVVGPLSVIVQ